MDFKILSEEKKPLLKRKEVVATIAYENQTPSRVELTTFVAGKLKIDEKVIVLKKIDTKYGTKNAELELRVYDSLESLKEIEPKHVIKKNVAEEPKKEGSEEKSE